MKGSRPASLLLFGLGFAVRAIPAPRVFDSETGVVHLFGGDAMYHLRRVLFSLEQFPATLRFDPYINFPFGGEPIWPPVFDGLLALLALPVYQGATPTAARSVETLLVWVPPVLGALAVVGLYHLCRRIFDEPTALASALVLAILPAHFWYSQVGFVDHHAAVALVFVTLLLAATRLLASLRDGRANSPAVALGGAAGFMLLVWPGGLLHVIVTLGFLYLAAIGANDRQEAIRHARALGIANAVAALLVTPFAWGAEWRSWGAFSPVVLSSFQPWLLAVFAATSSASAWVWSRRFGNSVGSRAAAGIGIGLAILAGSVALLPELIAGAGDALRWLLKDEAFQAVVAESKPLFEANGEFDRSAAEARLTRFLYLVPLAMAWMGVRSRGTPTARAVQLILVHGAILGIVTLGQRRFFNSWSIVYAATAGFAAVAAWRGLGERFQGGARAAAVCLLAIFALWLCEPIRDSYQSPLRNVIEALRGQPLHLPAGTLRTRQLDAAAAWLHANTPPTLGFLDPNVRPAYGVLSHWTHGHRIELLGRRPSIADGFGDDIGESNFLASYRFFQAEEQEARHLASALGARYVFLRTTPPGQGSLPPRAMGSRLSASREELAALDWLSLVYNEPIGVPGDHSRVRIFELRASPPHD